MLKLISIKNSLLLAFLFVLSFSAQGSNQRYKYDVTHKAISSEKVEFRGQNLEYDGSPNLRPCCSETLSSAFKEKAKNGPFFAFEVSLIVTKGTKPDFIVDSNGTAVRNSASGARKDLEAGGFKGSPTTETLESGTLHKGVLGRDEPMDVRIMDGQTGGGAFKGPRIRTTRSGSSNDGVRSDGSRFRNSESKSQRQAGSHIHLGGG